MEDDFDYISDQTERFLRRLARSSGLLLKKDGSAYTAGFRLYRKSNRKKFISVTIQGNEFHGDIEYKVSTIVPGNAMPRSRRHYNYQNFKREIENQVDCLTRLRKMAQSVIKRVAINSLRLKRQGQLF